MFSSVLIANRGEIALRIQRACRLLGLRTIAAYSEADRDAPHVRHADAAVCIGPPAAARSYLDPAAILLAAEATGAEAIHPGYGFLSENAAFAEAVAAAGLTFIGPDASCIRTMGDKVAAKRAMREAGVPCVPGPDGALPDDEAAVRQAAADIGYPVILKAAGGGGGRGMRVVERESDLLTALALTREEARRGFGNPAIYAEKFLGHPRHVEIRSSPTGMETRSGSAVATVRCSGDIRKCWRKRLPLTCRRRWWRRSARAAPRPAARSAT